MGSDKIRKSREIVSTISFLTKQYWKGGDVMFENVTTGQVLLMYVCIFGFIFGMAAILFKKNS